MDANYFHKIIYGRDLPKDRFDGPTRSLHDILWGSEIPTDEEWLQADADIFREPSNVQELLERTNYALDQPARLVGELNGNDDASSSTT